MSGDIETPRRPNEAAHIPADACRAALRTIPPAFAWCYGEQAILTLRNRFTPDQSTFEWWATFTPEDLLQAKVTVLCGPTGAGKTAAAVLAMRARCAAMPPSIKAVGSRFVPARELCPPADSGKSSRLREALEATLLILDDLGQEAHVTGWEREQRIDRTCFLLADRYDNKRDTIITTPLKPDTFAALYGGNTERRFWTEADVRVIAMQAPPVKVRT